MAAENTSDSAKAEDDAGKRAAFTVEVKGPDKVREYLAQNLEIQRYSRIPDLGTTELSRLMVAAEANARELLATLGYFTPTLTLELNETPTSDKAPRAVVVTVEPGATTQVTSAQILFNGPIESDPGAAAQREAIRKGWSLPPGQPFTQQGWDNAKTAGLRNLTAKRYATASVVTSRADVDADRHEAQLGITYQSGPAYRFGPLKISESKRYNPDAMRRVARVPTGEDYDQQKLLDAQQRMASSGYFDSVFLTLDTAADDPQTAPVLAQVREAPLQKVVAGVGFTTDSGARLSLDHTHNQVPLLGWRAVSKLSIDNDTRSLGTELNSIPDDNGWRWVNSALVKRENAGTYDVDSGRLRSGRSKSEDHIDRSYYLQYDYAKNRGTDAPQSAAAVSGNWAWTARYFDNNATPSRGYGIALELGAGYTLIGERLPFTRTFVRGLGFIPLGDVTSSDGSQARNSRIQLRGDLGAVVAKDAAQIPSTLMFLTGGDTTVRGYGYQKIGSELTDGSIVAGRYLGVLSAEWQRPFVWKGKLTEWESAVFVDAGAVGNTPSELKTKVGVGVGARWRSPFGPVQADIAYGEATRKFRLHLRLGFTF
ncbi:translocation and assembly module TamA [Variovorax ginsengisoli]|uniref:Translocation and assembly module TamA n=1 Tax=Variovorax ginsengisoli TaxID=363844 RepID=A0ABT9S2C3_9BURK|nr:translocation and assembly module TamA [Variovorax ginsengisoli]